VKKLIKKEKLLGLIEFFNIFTLVKNIVTYNLSSSAAAYRRRIRRAYRRP